MQAAQEYTGQQIHAMGLANMWEWYLQFDTRWDEEDEGDEGDDGDEGRDEERDGGGSGGSGGSRGKQGPTVAQLISAPGSVSVPGTSENIFNGLMGYGLMGY